VEREVNKIIETIKLVNFLANENPGKFVKLKNDIEVLSSLSLSLSLSL
jgi:hypothetical protein